MIQHFDISILGSGAFGSAAAYHLSKTGKKVLVLDRFHPPHDLGSSHGQTRIIREAYFESPVYVPLVQQAYRLWHDLEKESGKKLLLKTGGLMIGEPGSDVVEGAELSAKTYHLPYERLSAEEIKKRFPAFLPGQRTEAIYEKNAGILFQEACIGAQLELAKTGNMFFRFNEAVTGIEEKSSGFEISTDKGKYQTEKIILSAGAWTNNLLPGSELPLTVERQPLFWFTSAGGDPKKFYPEQFPIYIWQLEKDKIFYGFPDLGEGIKIAFPRRGKSILPDSVDRNISVEEIQELAHVLSTHFNIDPVYQNSAVCMYTNTPDEHFILDYHPQHKNIIIASPCSGHGFKFSSAIGKILCDMAMEKKPEFDLSVFSIARFGEKKTGGKNC